MNCFGIDDVEDIGRLVNDDERPITHDINLEEEFEDRFRDAMVINPYHCTDEVVSEQMNRITDPGEIAPSIHMTSDQIDANLLKIYTLDILAEYEKHLSNPAYSNKTSVITFEQINRIIAKKHHILYKKTDVYWMYNLLSHDPESIDKVMIKSFDKIRGFLQAKSFRSQSGVMVYAVFTHPFFQYGKNGTPQTFSCKYNCKYCPNMPGRPRSYVPGEPGNDRAHALGYDTIKQVHSRATAYQATGHINDKAEVIVLGGTWHSYPLRYRRAFIQLLYYAFNTIHGDRGRPIKTMREEIRLNETSRCRVIGLTIETRPDQITLNELRELRSMGTTRVQLGIQHTNDRILRRIQRRCTADDGIRAIKMLKDQGFKVDIHLMPDLPKPFTFDFEEKNKTRMNDPQLQYTVDDIDQTFESVTEDRLMFEEVFHSDRYQPDQVKIYPCEVMDWTDIKKDFENGIHVPYGTIKENQTTNELIELLISVKTDFPEECRINRLIRDIPESYILGGMNDPGGRQRIERMMKQRGVECKCIRCREIKKKKINHDDVRLKITHFTASGGDEYFLQYVVQTTNELIGFLRLRVSSDSGYIVDKNQLKRKLVFDELVGAAMIRELHVYGETVQVSVNQNQHKCKDENIKKQSDQKQSDHEPSDREPSDREPSDREPSDREPSDREPSDREPSDREPSDREPSDREPSDREPSDREPSDRERSKQHQGYGTRLINNALALAQSLGFDKITVISGEGVKPYYRRFGFVDGRYFLSKNLGSDPIKYVPDIEIESIIHKVHRYNNPDNYLTTSNKIDPVNNPVYNPVNNPVYNPVNNPMYDPVNDPIILKRTRVYIYTKNAWILIIMSIFISFFLIEYLSVSNAHF
jgi:histone acetyltransferase (RNA polymerase elongator complex component)